MNLAAFCGRRSGGARSGDIGRYFMFHPIKHDTSNLPAQPNPEATHFNDRYRPRDLGTGYGKSEGYASKIKYVDDHAGNEKFRVK